MRLVATRIKSTDSPELYYCDRCGREGRTSSKRKYNAQGKRNDLYCEDCKPIIQKEKRAAAKAAKRRAS